MVGLVITVEENYSFRILLADPFFIGIALLEKFIFQFLLEKTATTNTEGTGGFREGGGGLPSPSAHLEHPLRPFVNTYTTPSDPL